MAGTANNRYRGGRGKSRQTVAARYSDMCGGGVRRKASWSAVSRTTEAHATDDDIKTYRSMRQSTPKEAQYVK